MRGTRHGRAGWKRKVAWVRQKSKLLRSERSELLFGSAVVQCGLDGGPGVPGWLLVGGPCRRKDV